jgi:type II secretory pathway pseudopilin PulG
MRSSNAGFAYVILLISIAVLAMGAASAVTAGAQLARRSSEEHLLYVGGEFEKALLSYARSSGNVGPKQLSDLLKDARVPGVRRHLRRLYEDPLTGSQDWGLKQDAAGRIIGIFSLAPGKPIKQTGFDARHQSFEQAEIYSDWVFGLPYASRLNPPRAAAGLTPGRLVAE